MRCRIELLGLDYRELGRAIVETYLGASLIAEAVDAALLVSARTRTTPTRRSVRYLALSRLSALVDRELDRRLAALERNLDVDHLDA